MPYPWSQMNRSDPGMFTDGQGAQHIDLESGFNGVMQYEPFGDMLNPTMKNGFKI
jgi:hypothetical protein